MNTNKYQRCIMGGEIICDGKSICCNRSQFHEDYMKPIIPKDYLEPVSKLFPSPDTIRQKYPDITGLKMYPATGAAIAGSGSLKAMLPGIQKDKVLVKQIPIYRVRKISLFMYCLIGVFCGYDSLYKSPDGEFFTIFFKGWKFNGKKPFSLQP